MFSWLNVFYFGRNTPIQVDFVLHIYKFLIQEFSYNDMDFECLSEDDTTIYILLDALILHHFSSKVVEENLGQAKRSALHKVIQDELVSVRQEIL